MPNVIVFVFIFKQKTKKSRFYNPNCPCNKKTDFFIFGQHVGDEMRSSQKSRHAVQVAKYEINKILYYLSTGQYDLPFADIQTQVVIKCFNCFKIYLLVKF